MTHTFMFDCHEWVRHKMLNQIEGYVAEVSIDDAGVEWVKVARLIDNEFKADWLRAKECERFAPIVNGFGK